jgi:hypothetical protein
MDSRGAVVDRAARSWMDLNPDTSLVLHADAFQDFTFRWALGSAVGRFQWCRRWRWLPIALRRRDDRGRDVGDVARGRVC